jgi:hypothetical protein
VTSGAEPGFTAPQRGAFPDCCNVDTPLNDSRHPDFSYRWREPAKGEVSFPPGNISRAWRRTGKQNAAGTSRRRSTAIAGTCAVPKATADSGLTLPAVTVIDPQPTGCTSSFPADDHRGDPCPHENLHRVRIRDRQAGQVLQMRGLQATTQQAGSAAEGRPPRAALHRSARPSARDRTQTRARATPPGRDALRRCMERCHSRRPCADQTHH